MLAKMTIELHYDQDTLSVMTDRAVTDEGFLEVAKEYAIHDLLDLMRTHDIEEWAIIEVSEEESN